MRALLVLLLLLSLPACAKRPMASADQLYASRPQLPAPRAGSYTRLASRPSDPVIARLVGNLTWDVSLSGAAAGLALAALEGETGMYAWQVREKAWDAGYPYPATRVRLWTTPRESAPPPELLEFLKTLDPSVDLGLVRARGDEQEAWVALTASPRLSVGRQPRQVEVGHRLTLPATPGARWVLVDPVGGVISGSLDTSAEHVLDVTGEWLVQVEDAQGVAAKFPIYVGMAPPKLGLLDDEGAPLNDDELRRRATDLLQELRLVYGLEEWTGDVLLQATARNALSEGVDDVDALARRLGFDPRRFGKLECRAITVEDCVDRMVWSPTTRSALLSRTTLWGLAARREQPGVRILALVAAE